MTRSVSFQKPLVNTEKSLNQSLNQRSLLLFHSAIKTPATQKTYNAYLQQFKENFLIKSYDKLIEIEPKKTSRNDRRSYHVL